MLTDIKKQYIRNISLIAIAAAIAATTTNSVVKNNEPQAGPEKEVTEVAKADISNNENEKIAQELGNYVFTQMKIVNARMTDVRKQVLARQIVSVSMEIFDNQEHRKQFVTLVAIESKFDFKAKSHVGAVGLTQVMPQYAGEFAKVCGISNLDSSDIEMAEINLLVGACRFRHLLEIFSGQTSLALVAYNAGASSNQIKQLQELRNLSTVETSSYISKWLFLKEKTSLEINKNSETDR